VFSGEQGAHVCSHRWPAPNRVGYRRRVLERWGHSNVQCSSSCNASGARHQGHALRDLGTLRGPSVAQTFNVKVVRVCAQFDQADGRAAAPWQGSVGLRQFLGLSGRFWRRSLLKAKLCVLHKSGGAQ
jgi:hypothetical protein